MGSHFRVMAHGPQACNDDACTMISTYSDVDVWFNFFATVRGI